MEFRRGTPTQGAVGVISHFRIKSAPIVGKIGINGLQQPQNNPWTSKKAIVSHIAEDV